MKPAIADWSRTNDRSRLRRALVAGFTYRRSHPLVVNPSMRIQAEDEQIANVLGVDLPRAYASVGDACGGFRDAGFQLIGVGDGGWTIG